MNFDMSHARDSSVVHSLGTSLRSISWRNRSVFCRAKVLIWDSKMPYFCVTCILCYFVRRLSDMVKNVQV